MLDPHVLKLSLAVEEMAGGADDGAALAARVRRAFPREPVGTLRRAFLYAVTSPDLRDSEITAKLYDAAFAVLALANPDPEALIRDRDKDDERKKGQ